MENREILLEYAKEKVKIYTEVLKILSAFTAATAGGIVSLLFKLDYKISLPLIAFGLWLEIFFIFGTLKVWLLLNRHTEEIKKWTEKS